jgi:hypothetical protein
LIETVNAQAVEMLLVGNHPGRGYRVVKALHGGKVRPRLYVVADDVQAVPFLR